MIQKGPGRYYREGMSLIDVMAIFPNDETAERWFIERRWADGISCPHCHSANIQEKAKHATMSSRCRSCRKFFSVRTETAMQDSKIGYQKWAIAFYLMATGIKGVSSMKLHRDLGVTQKTAWHLSHRIRESWDDNGEEFEGPIEADEAYFGGLEKNKHKAKKLNDGRGPVGKTAVLGVKDRKTKHVAAMVAESIDKITVQDFIGSKAKAGAKLYTDDSRAYEGLDREAVRHSLGEYVRGQAHTNGMESFWAMLKRGFYGTYHRMSPKHLHRYVKEFAGRHNQRPDDTVDQLSAMVRGICGKRLTYKELIG